MADRHQAPSYPLRMPEELKSRVAEAASQSGRSLHAELLVKIEQALEGGRKGVETDRQLARMDLLLAQADVQKRSLQISLGELAEGTARLLPYAHSLESDEVAALKKQIEEAKQDGFAGASYAQDAADELLKKSAAYQTLVNAAQPTDGPIRGWTSDQGSVPAIPGNPEDLLRLAEQRRMEAETLEDTYRSYRAHRTAAQVLKDIEQG